MTSGDWVDTGITDGLPFDADAVCCDDAGTDVSSVVRVMKITAHNFQSIFYVRVGEAVMVASAVQVGGE